MPIPAETPVLTDGVVTLRAPRPEDLPAALKRYADDPASSYGEDDIRRWMTYGIAEAWATAKRLVFVIEHQGQYAGSVGLQPDPDGNASVHYGLSRWARGSGVAARAVRLVLEFGFAGCGFSVIHWRAAVGNWASRRVAWATGFRFGPTIPDLIEFDGRRHESWTAWIGPEDERKPRQPWFDNPVLETPRIRLRSWRDDEIDRITTARTNQATGHFLPFIPQPFTAEDARFWLKDLAEQAATGTRYNWCIADAESDLGLGNLTLFNLRDGRDGELGFWAHPDAQGRGLMTEAIRRVATWYFAPEADGGLGRHRLMIRTAATNQAARKVAAAAGFRQVATERSTFALGNHTLDDQVTYDRLAADAQL